mgnify:CR=1 FL=1
MSSNASLKVSEQRVRESQARVTEAKTNYLPSVDLNFQYTPSQRFPLIQIPAAGSAVLVPYKSSTTSNVTNLNLSDAQMCAVFSNKTGGQTWGQLRGTTDATTVKVVYRTDNSGTTELLSRYLVAACPTSGFVVSNNFATMVAGAVTGGTIPAHWFGANGQLKPSKVERAAAERERAAVLLQPSRGRIEAKRPERGARGAGCGRARSQGCRLSFNGTKGRR